MQSTHRSSKINAAAALRAQAKALLALADAIEVDAPEQGASEWFDLARSPRGRRVAYAAARRGEIEGAIKTGKRWLCRVEAHDAWLARSATPKPTRTVPQENVIPLREQIDRALGIRRVSR